jgi:hypothetical protein
MRATGTRLATSMAPYELFVSTQKLAQHVKSEKQTHVARHSHRKKIFRVLNYTQKYIPGNDENLIRVIRRLQLTPPFNLYPFLLLISSTIS